MTVRAKTPRWPAGIALASLILVAGCGVSSPDETSCKSAISLASANTNLSDALSALERSDPRAYELALAFANVDYKNASALVLGLPDAPPGMPAGTTSTLASALKLTGSIIEELPTTDSLDIPALRTRVRDAQAALEANPGLPGGCTEPIRPPVGTVDSLGSPALAAGHTYSARPKST